ncbi:MAG: ribosome-associated translation inhibitor RaiA [Oligoflexales bacterium]|nr:ribosome-associated translation inhibitor RaiA [Oligoflexales bacterium]
MKNEIDIVYRGLPQSDSLDFEIKRRATKLEKLFDQTQSMRVLIEDAHKHQHKGNVYHVHIEMHVPGNVIVVNKARDENKAHTDAKVAIRDAFDAAEKQLRSYVEKLKGKVKTHSSSAEADLGEDSDETTSNENI